VTGERGSGSILAVAVVAAALMLSLALVPLYGVLLAKRQAAGAADLAALAAADVAVGAEPGIPCRTASSIARANDVALRACRLEGVIVTVRVSASVLGFTVPGIATAGPPGALPK
jgi:secretion/DNA translocation related TadE-like protein